MSYPEISDPLPVRRFATLYAGRAAARGEHGGRIARLLGAKLGCRAERVVGLMARPLAREAVRGFGPAGRALARELLDAPDPFRPSDPADRFQVSHDR
ncbi:MAG: hypothetical protein FJX02_15975 [Alphaproteobacteria bacterium]|nr:hypothetical protein [Alphaproteobacteria bacterium]